MDNFDEVESLVKDSSGSNGASSQQLKRTLSPSSSSSNTQQHLANKCRTFVSIPALLVLACILVVGKLTIKTSYDSAYLDEDEFKGKDAETSDLVPSPGGGADSSDIKALPVPPKAVTAEQQPTDGGNQPPTQPQQDVTNAAAAEAGGQDEAAAVDSSQTATGTSGETAGGTPPATTAGESSEGGGIPVEKPGFKRNPRQYSEAYLPRGAPEKTGADLSQLANKWGSWTLVDEKAATRPKEDFFAAHPNRDIPWDEIPAEAWQRDPEYLSKFLKEGIDLTDRAMEAILSEYGQGKDDKPELDFEERSKLFMPTLKDLEPKPAVTAETAEKPDTRRLDGLGNGNWIAKRSYKSLVRRLLHAVVTEDTFTFSMGGHSSAAGHGNNFQQTYTPQLQWLLEPVLARLGVFFESHNVGMGGLGTLQNAVASGDVYGKEVDILMWDSSMTEKSSALYDVFARQGLIGGNRAPILIGGKGLEGAYKHYDAEIGSIGPSYNGLPKTMNAEQALEVPYAARYMSCDREAKSICKKYNGTCWVDRPDFTPTTKQRKEPGGGASWHPGNRSHQIRSRGLAFPILMALRDALKLWQGADGYVLSDGDFHMTPEYKNTQSKVIAAEEKDAPCYKVGGLPHNFCKYPVNGRSEFLPRSNPVTSSIRSIMKHGDYFPQGRGNLYDPPDVYNPYFNPPAGEVNYLHIVENGVDYVPSRGRRNMVALRKSLIGWTKGLSADGAFIKPDDFWGIDTKTAGDNCDGTYDSFCGRGSYGDCLLYGHNDHRGGIDFDSHSGWIVLQVDQVRYGTIVVKIEHWRKKDCSKNECGKGPDRNLFESSEKIPEMTGAAGSEDVSGWNGLSRRLPTECKGNFTFEFAIDGKITSWTFDEFVNQNLKHGSRNVEFWWLVNDPEFAKDGPRDVEVALRITGCDPHSKIYNVMALTHVYWN